MDGLNNKGMQQGIFCFSAYFCIASLCPTGLKYISIIISLLHDMVMRIIWCTASLH